MKMPQASSELRDLMGHYFSSRIDDKGPSDFLIGRGYKLTDEFCWELPHEKHFVSVKEELCLRFLHEEWDYGFGAGL
jgi:hypothetical protein